MGRRKKGAPVVITRKDKKLNKTGHGLVPRSARLSPAWIGVASSTA